MTEAEKAAKHYAFQQASPMLRDMIPSMSRGALAELLRTAHLDGADRQRERDAVLVQTATTSFDAPMVGRVEFTPEGQRDELARLILQSCDENGEKS